MEILVGRRGTQRTPITDPSVSREHCKLTSNADGTWKSSACVTPEAQCR